MSICTGETSEDFAFVFNSLIKGLLKLFNFKYLPKTLIADGADAITNGFMIAFGYEKHDFKRVMCWAHVVRNIDKRIYVITDEVYRNSIKQDIKELQKSYCVELFTLGYELLEKKWLSTKSGECKTFFEYFRKEWINSTNSGWYEGLTQGEHTPSTDNALESINGKIKSIHTLRERLAVNSYLRNAYEMLRNWSKDSLTERQFSTSYNVSAKTWGMADDFLRSPESILKRFGGKKSNVFILTTKAFNHFINSDYINKNYAKIKDLNFDLLMEYRANIKIIDFNTENWATSKCSCWFYLKNYHCYHLISIAVNLNLATIPMRYIKSAIEPKKKAGRSDKAKKALIVQK